MKKLFVIFTIFFCLNSISAFAKEYIMTCGDSKLKLEKTFFFKDIYVRFDAKWQKYCTEENQTLTIFDDGAECSTKYETDNVFIKEAWEKTEDLSNSVILDFYLKTAKFKSLNKADRTMQCIQNKY
jgi:hypothetical protein